ncbi:hypothetical protein BaRGS_00014796 [Batillaria attramentaria]|uniref:Uncharacterized protein n=1 Tax=Batillaria attramentaria TaxID=370345 RepID=A0ABD0L467_9CAEN
MADSNLQHCIQVVIGTNRGARGYSCLPLVLFTCVGNEALATRRPQTARHAATHGHMTQSLQTELGYSATAATWSSTKLNTGTRNSLF